MSEADERRNPGLRGRMPCAAAAAALVTGLLVSGPGLADQTLDESLIMSYVSNPTLAAARAELRTVNEQIPQALSNWRPRVTFQGDVGQQYNDNFGATDPGSSTPRSAELDITQSLYRGGRTVAETRRAEATVRSQRASLLDVEQQVLVGAATAYIDVWRDQSVLDLNINNEQVLNRQLEASRDRFEVGEVTRTDVAQSESRLARAVGDRVAAEGNLSISRAIYQEIVGVSPGILDRPPLPNGLPGTLDESLAAAEGENPAVVAATFAEISEEANVRVQFGQLLPEVSVVGSLSKSEETTAADSKNERARVLAQVTVPIYQQGFVSSQIREAKQRSSQRRLEIDEARRNAEQQSITAWEALQTARAQIEAFESEVRSTDIALEGVRQENAVGARTILDILDAEQEFLDAQVNLVRAQRDEIVASYQVLQAMGLMTAEYLVLPVTLYDPDRDLEEVRDVWFGFGGLPEE